MKMPRKLLSWLLGAFLFFTQAALAVQTDLASSYNLSGTTSTELTGLSTADTYTGISPDAIAVRFTLFNAKINNTASTTKTVTLQIKRDGSAIATSAVLTLQPGNQTVQLPFYDTGIAVGAHTYTAWATGSGSATLTFVAPDTYLLVSAPNADAVLSGTVLTIGTTTIASGTNTYLLYNNAGVLGNIASAPTATALAANGANCSAGSAPLGVDASGAAESCTDYEEDLSNSAGLLAALSDETGTGVAVFGTSPTIATPILTGKIDRNNVAVDDDDCTGEQGLVWYDTTDSQFEWCNANSGAPTVLGGSGITGSLTSGRIPVASGASTLADTSNFTFDTTNFRLRGQNLTTASDGTLNMVQLSGTLPSSTSADVFGLFLDVTGAGTAANNQFAADIYFRAGYTGASRTRGLNIRNENAGTGATLNLGNVSGAIANAGVVASAAASTAGINIGSYGYAASSTTTNVGVYGNGAGTAAGQNIGVIATASGSTEGTNLLNVGLLASLGTAELAAVNGSFGALIDGATLPNSNSNALRVDGTLPSTLTGTTSGVYFNVTSAGSTAGQTSVALRTALNAGYTGSAATHGVNVGNAAVGTGATLNLGNAAQAVANVGGSSIAFGVGAGITIGWEGRAQGSTGVNIGDYGRANDTAQGSNIGVLGNAGNSTESVGLVNVGVLGTTDTALPAANVSAGVMAAAAAGGFPVRAYYDDTEVMRIDDSATATHTYLMIYDVDNATLERVTVGAADSGGVGFKVLAIPN